MKKTFQNITLMGRHRTNAEEIHATIKDVYTFLTNQNVNVYIEQDTASRLTGIDAPIMEHKDFGKCDLLIAVGGDGNLIHASHLAVEHHIPVLGINKGRLGFLTDIKPQNFEQELGKILSGEYTMEQRFLLDAVVHDDACHVVREHIALNDVVLLPNELEAHMISFTIYINDELVCEQRADGLIISTPTGSTAYSLSGGGPILYPLLDAIALVPMFPHTLSSRPIVIPGENKIRIRINQDNESSPRLSCDGQRRILIHPGQEVMVKKHHTSLTILHPISYNYYETLRSKLGWK